MNKILIISFYTYPCKLVGAKRMSYIANYLIQEGASVTIIKANNEAFGNQVDKELKLDPEISIIEVTKLNKFKTYIQAIYRFFRFKKVINNLLKNESFDIIYFSGGPFFYFPLGILCKFKYKIPYILDFRDLWIIGELEDLNWKGKILRKFEKYFEKKSAEYADLIVSVSPRITEMYNSEFCSSSKLEILTVLNGYNDTELPRFINKPLKKNNSIKIGIFGKFSYYNYDHLNILFEAINKLKNSIEVQVHHIGLTENDFSNLVKMNYLSENFTFLGYKNYSEGIKYLSKMDFLILNNRTEYALGTKIFDYLYLNKPIFSFIMRNSEIWNLLSQFKNTYLIHNSNDLISAIQSLLISDDWSVITKQELEKYSRKTQTAILYNKIIMLLEKRIINNDNR